MFEGQKRWGDDASAVDLSRRPAGAFFRAESPGRLRSNGGPRSTHISVRLRREKPACLERPRSADASIEASRTASCMASIWKPTMRALSAWRHWDRPAAGVRRLLQRGGNPVGRRRVSLLASLGRTHSTRENSIFRAARRIQMIIVGGKVDLDLSVRRELKGGNRSRHRPDLRPEAGWTMVSRRSADRADQSLAFE